MGLVAIPVLSLGVDVAIDSRSNKGALLHGGVASASISKVFLASQANSLDLLINAKVTGSIEKTCTRIVQIKYDIFF
jgi:hypothetical protein